MYGQWDYSGSYPEVFRCSFDEFDVYIEKCAIGATGQDVYYLRRIRSSHPSNPNFRRLIAFVHSKSNHGYFFVCVCVYLYILQYMYMYVCMYVCIHVGRHMLPLPVAECFCMKSVYVSDSLAIMHVRDDHFP